MEKVRKILDSHQAKISEAVKSSLPDFSETLFEKGLISKAVKNKPDSYNNIVNDFKANLPFLGDTEKLKSTLGDFLDCLRDLGGAPARAAEMLKEELDEVLVESVWCMYGERTIKRSRKENKNKGQFLYKCRRKGENNCGFLKWAHEIGSSTNQPHPPASRGRGGTEKGRGMLRPQPTPPPLHGPPSIGRGEVPLIIPLILMADQDSVIKQ